MRYRALILSFAVGTALVAGCSKPPEEALADRMSLFGKYCTDCHSDAEQAGGMSLEHVKPADVAAHPERFEQVVRRLRGSVMPPPGEPKPDHKQANALIASLEATLDKAAETRGVQPGRVALHRLNRSEYETAVRDLLGVEVDASKLLPSDQTSDGFDNVAEVLRVTPTYLDQYIAAAREVSVRAVGSPAAKAQRAEYVAHNANHTVHVDGLPLGTRDGLAVEHYFPSDGEYVFNLNVYTDSGAELRAYPHGWLDYEHTAILTLDGVKVFEGKLGGEQDLRDLDRYQIVTVNAIKDRFRNIRLPVKAGYHKVAATFIARDPAESDYQLQSFVPGEGVPDVPQMRGFDVVGPFQPSGIETTRSRERIFTCRPTAPADELPCAEQILSRLARLAFRRPADESEIERLLGFYKEGHEQGGFETGIQKGLLAILASTNFLYRGEPGGAPAGVEAGEVYPITDVELASRLSFFLWSQGPDDELLKLAEANQLHEPKVYEAQVRRMFADPRAESLVTDFAFQWLSVRNLDMIEPDPKLFPNYDADLKRAFVTEMQLFLESILLDDKKNVVDLLNAPYTFVNERLARHYGIPGVLGDQFRRVELADPQRWGLFGKGSVLMATSYPDRTSPVLRGAWIMEHLLGVPPTPPPPDVVTNLAPAQLESPKSVRERLALHRTNQSCNHCHGVIDPLGQALENYSAIGEWRMRERDTGVAIDPNGRLASGQEVSSPVDLRAALSSEPEKLVQTLAQDLLTFALGRRVEAHDMPSVRAIVRDSKDKGFTFESIVIGVAKSAPFRMRTAPEIPPGETVAAEQDAPSAPAGTEAGGR
jgi:mono/diheme cytochrome c family protein